MKSNKPRESKKSSKLAVNLPRSGVVQWIIPAAIALATVAVFLPALRNEFVDWDDLVNLVDNLNYRGLGWRHLRWMFTTFHESLYRPITWLTFGLDYLLWGMDPAGYHLTSLLFHCANAATFYFVALSFLRSAILAEKFSELGLRMGAAFAALVFSLHPLRVETVAWASARNDVVSAWFFLLALIAYLRAAGAVSRSAPEYRRWLTVALILYAGSLGAKAAGMTLPAALLVLDVYPLRRLQGAPWRWLEPPTRGIIFEKVPFFLLALAAAVVALIAKQEFQAVHSLAAYGWPVRLVESFYGLAFYLWKTVLPFSLSPLYQLPAQTEILTWPFLLSAISVVILTAALVILRTKWPAGAACWGWYGVLLIPFLGLVQFGPQIVADRYSYLSCLSWSLLAAGAFYRYSNFGKPRQQGRTMVAGAIAGIVIMALAYLTWNQIGVWRDTKTLWLHVLKVAPNSSIAHYNLARLLAKQGLRDEAIDHYRQALAFKPNDADTHNNLGLLLAQRGDAPAALAAFQRAVELDPAHAKAYYNMGRLYAGKGDFNNAVGYYQRALKLQPGEAEVYFVLGAALARQGRLREATDHFREAVKLRPDSADAHASLGRALAEQGKKEEAASHYQEAIRILKPVGKTDK